MRLLALTIAVLLTITTGSLSAKPLADMTPETILATQNDELLVLDVRSEREYQRGHVPGAVHIPHKQLEQRLAELDQWRKKSVVVYCETGYRARIAASLLEERGFEEVFHLVGDMQDWRDSGREIAF